MPIAQHAPALVVTLLVALVYLGVVRLVDLNEKEPLWAIATLFVLGGLAACGLGLVVNMAVLELRGFPAVLAKELGRFAAVAAGVAILQAVAARRGWSDINGLMDGVVYGAAGGLGFASGHVLVRQVTMGSLASLGEVSSSALSAVGIGTVALRGLADGVFGALMGIGFAAALQARKPWQRALFPLGGYVAAALAHLSYQALGHGNALGGGEGLLRRWLALLLPVLVVAVVTIVALRQEKKAIRVELATEADTGIVTAREHALLQSFFSRESLYWRALWRGGFRASRALRELHNRQVQLALAKQRGASSGEQPSDEAALRELMGLRRAVVQLKNTLERTSSFRLPAGWFLPAPEGGSRGGPAAKGKRKAARGRRKSSSKGGKS